MDNHNFEERMNKLKKGYEEMEERTDPKAVLTALTTKEPVRPKRPKNNWIVPLISVAAIFTLFLFAMSLVNPPTNSASEEEEKEEVSESGLDFVYISQEIDRQYAEIREEARVKMGLDDEEFSQIQAVVYADQGRNHFMSVDFIDYHDAYGDTEESIIETAVDELSWILTTPEEFLAQQYENSFHTKRSLEESGYVLSSYMRKLLDFEEVGSDVVASDVQIPESQLPTLSQILHPKFEGLIKFYALGKLTEAGEMIYPYELTARSLIEIEESISDEAITIEGESHRVANLLYLTLKGTMSENQKDHQAILFENGVLKKEVQDQWKHLAEQPENTVVHAVFAPIVKEMLDTGWTSSTTWENISYEDAQIYIREMDSAKYKVAQSKGDAVLVDAQFEQRIHNYFKELALVPGLDKYKALSPEEIVGLYHYYGQLGELELRYELYIQDERYLQIPKDEYLASGSIEYLPLQKYVKAYTFINQGLDLNGNETGLVEVELTERGASTHDTPVMLFQLIKTEDGWKMPFMPTQ
ncbi:hypothetical protein ACF3OH_09015 [Chryseomicrobium aureum]|uniref:hypothetical protein n=1 Tax=Chryseomicrobium aureum TaxID=1441723 RepID=UPI00370DB89F